LADACYYAWQIVLAYYLGGLVSDDDKDLCNAEKRGGVFDEDHCTLLLEPLSDGGTCKDLDGATARALKYSSRIDYSKRDLELRDRHIDAYRRLFAKIGLDFDATERDVLFDGLSRW
jgi:hypothetical protein